MVIFPVSCDPADVGAGVPAVGVGVDFGAELHPTNAVAMIISADASETIFFILFFILLSPFGFILLLV
jgi:hypothetical protein